MDDLLAKLQELKPEELDYVMARSSSNTIGKACEEAGISESTIYKWKNRKELDDLALALRLDRHIEVELKLREALPDAVQVIIDGIKERRYTDKFKAAVEVLDRTLGKPTQKIDAKTEHSGSVTLEGAVDALKQADQKLNDDKRSDV
jgi:transposase-like protein